MSEGPSSSPATRLARGLFLAYACLLLVLTHWPRLELPAADIPRPDLAIHIGAFALWAFLCARASWFGPFDAPRNLLLAGALAIAYAALDEASQAIPAVQRAARWDDLAANLLGIGAGLAGASLLAALDEPTSEQTRQRERADP